MLTLHEECKNEVQRDAPTLNKCSFPRWDVKAPKDFRLFDA